LGAPTDEIDEFDDDETAPLASARARSAVGPRAAMMGPTFAGAPTLAEGHGHSKGRRRAPSGAAVMTGGVFDRIRYAGTGGWLAITGVVLAAAVGVFLIVHSATVAPNNDARNGATTPAATVAPTTDTPLIPVQHYSDPRGIVVNVPEGWTRYTGSGYVDFLDPAGGRKIRINVETSTNTAQHFLEGAEAGLERPTVCPAPYHRVGLRDVTLDGYDAAELEYTCGSGDTMRHGIWRAIVVNGKAYHFYLTVPDSAFDTSKVIYDEMVRSFRLTLS
jgi:hypothetical protein